MFICNDTIQQTTCNFLLVFNTNYVSIRDAPIRHWPIISRPIIGA